MAKIKTKDPNIKSNSAQVITNVSDYNNLMEKIESLVSAGNGTIRSQDMLLYTEMANAAQKFEQNTWHVPSPETLEGLLEWKMYELKLKQHALAEKLHISDTKLSLVMNGKQKPDARLLKSIHTELGVDGNVLLGMV